MIPRGPFQPLTFCDSVPGHLGLNWLQIWRKIGISPLPSVTGRLWDLLAVGEAELMGPEIVPLCPTPSVPQGLWH